MLSPGLKGIFKDKKPQSQMCFDPIFLQPDFPGMRVPFSSPYDGQWWASGTSEEGSSQVKFPWRPETRSPDSGPPQPFLPESLLWLWITPWDTILSFLMFQCQGSVDKHREEAIMVEFQASASGVIQERMWVNLPRGPEMLTPFPPLTLDSWWEEDRLNTVSPPPLHAHFWRTSPLPANVYHQPPSGRPGTDESWWGRGHQMAGGLVDSPPPPQHQDSEARPEVRKSRSLLQNHSKITQQQFLRYIAKGQHALIESLLHKMAF